MAKPPDSFLKSSRREAIVVGMVWLISFSFSVPYCYYHGYQQQELQFVFGIPDWIFWGVFTPWIACILFTGWFAFRFMTDGDLQDEPSPRK